MHNKNAATHTHTHTLTKINSDGQMGSLGQRVNLDFLKCQACLNYICKTLNKKELA